MTDAVGPSSSPLRRWSPVLGGLAAGLTLAVILGAALHTPLPLAAAAPTTSARPAQSGSVAPSASPVARCSPRPGTFAERLSLTTFYKGNVHTHSNWSDGDSSPEDVIRTYRDAKYDFLALTDHNTFTNPALFARHARPGMVLISGEEITFWSGRKPVHVNALCAPKGVGYRHTFATNQEALAAALAAVRAHPGAVALVNHPNYEWALHPEDVLAAKDADLLEIWSGHPNVASEGDAEHPSHVALWDLASRSGIRFGAAAVDDAHHYRTQNKGLPARPFRGWLQVAADAREPGAICRALREKKLYASSGPALTSIEVGARALVVKAAEPLRIEVFAGKGCDGKTATATESVAVFDGVREARWELRGGETYVRAEAKDAAGKTAWTQAYFVVPPAD